MDNFTLFLCDIAVIAELTKYKSVELLLLFTFVFSATSSLAYDLWTQATSAYERRARAATRGQAKLCERSGTMCDQYDLYCARSALHWKSNTKRSSKTRVRPVRRTWVRNR